jgi:hypothetical protein
LTVVHVCGGDGSQRLRFESRGVVGHFVDERGKTIVGIGSESGIGSRIEVKVGTGRSVGREVEAVVVETEVGVMWRWRRR